MRELFWSVVTQADTFPFALARGSNTRGTREEVEHISERLEATFDSSYQGWGGVDGQAFAIAVVFVLAAMGLVGCNKKVEECNKVITVAQAVSDRVSKMTNMDKPEDAEQMAATIEQGVTEIKAVPLSDAKLKGLIGQMNDNDTKLVAAIRDIAGAIRKTDTEALMKQKELINTLHAKTRSFRWTSTGIAGTRDILLEAQNTLRPWGRTPATPSTRD